MFYKQMKILNNLNQLCFSLSQDTGANTILQDIARARENIQKSLAGVSSFLTSTAHTELNRDVKVFNVSRLLREHTCAAYIRTLTRFPQSAHCPHVACVLFLAVSRPSSALS